MDQIRVKYHAITFRLIDLAVAVYTRHLSWCKKNQGSFLVIISIPPINHISAFHVFEEDRIEPKIHTVTLPWSRF